MKLIAVVVVGLLVSFTQFSVYADSGDRPDRRQESTKSDDRKGKPDCRRGKNADKAECKTQESQDDDKGRRTKASGNSKGK